MRIAQVSPLYESVPPSHYGGTERVVSYLTEELVRQGHEVTLFASGDSRTSARLVPGCAQALRLHPQFQDPIVPHLIMIERAAAMARAGAFDVIHFHTDYHSFPQVRQSTVPCVTTIHGRLDLPDLGPLYREFRDVPVVSISDFQRRPQPWANWVATVHHGLPLDLYRFVGQQRRGAYVAFIGRVSREKRLDLAIQIARLARVELLIAAKVDKADREYFEREIRPLLGEPGARFIGEIGDREKNEFLGNALAMLFPIDWPEPFGLVMIESMACGTPVIAFPRGSVPEVIDHGVTGLIVNSVEEAAAALGHADSMDRRACRARFEERFISARMARDYLRVYERMMAVGPGMLDVGGEGRGLRRLAQAIPPGRGAAPHAPHSTVHAPRPASDNPRGSAWTK
jgi:glycosyltransferase involved in cell wall biosynthesis